MGMNLICEYQLNILDVNNNGGWDVYCWIHHGACTDGCSRKRSKLSGEKVTSETITLHIL